MIGVIPTFIPALLPALMTSFPETYTPILPVLLIYIIRLRLNINRPAFNINRAGLHINRVWLHVNWSWFDVVTGDADIEGDVDPCHGRRGSQHQHGA